MKLYRFDAVFHAESKYVIGFILKSRYRVIKWEIHAKLAIILSKPTAFPPETCSIRSSRALKDSSMSSIE